jgi:hypothetical protein
MSSKQSLNRGANLSRGTLYSAALYTCKQVARAGYRRLCNRIHGKVSLDEDFSLCEKKSRVNCTALGIS